MRIEWLPQAARNLTALGRPGRVPSTRELVVVGTPYVVAYRIERTVVLVLHILHGAQRWPPA